MRTKNKFRFILLRKINDQIEDSKRRRSEVRKSIQDPHKKNNQSEENSNIREKRNGKTQRKHPERKLKH